MTHCFHKIFSRRFWVRLRRTPSSPPYRWPNSHVLSLSRGKSSSSSRTASSSRGASSSGFSSPLDYGRASPSSSYGKRSASPSHRGGGKRSKGGRGMSPSVKSHQGFWKKEPYPWPSWIGGCLSLHWQAWRDRGADPWVEEEPIPFSTYSPSSIKGKALEEAILSLIEKGAVKLAPLPSPGFYSRVFVVWRPVINLSALNRFVLRTPFKMETLQVVLLSVRQGD